MRRRREPLKKNADGKMRRHRCTSIASAGQAPIGRPTLKSWLKASRSGCLLKLGSPHLLGLELH